MYKNLTGSEKSEVYSDYLGYLCGRKRENTAAKIAKNGFMNEDDYGSVLPPEDFSFTPYYNDEENKTFYGARAWAENFSRLMSVHPICADARDAIVGKWMFILQRMRPDGMDMAPAFDYGFLKDEQKKYGIISGIGKMQHFAPDYEIALALGWGGLREKVEKYAALNPDKAEFYECELKTIDAVTGWIARCAAKVRAMAESESAPLLRENLTEAADCCEKAVSEPPETLREVCQWIAFFTMVSHTYDRDGAGCQLDAVLQRYYDRDRAAGRCDREDALYFVSCLLLNNPQYYQISGPDASGEDLTCEMSYIILEAAHRLKVTANLTVRVHAKMDEKLFETAVSNLLADKTGCPRFSGDDSLIKGFMKNGYSIADARARIAVGCHWMALPGREYTLNDTVKINLAKVFEEAFLEGTELSDGGPTVDRLTVDRLFERFERHLRRAVDCVKRGIDFHLKYQRFNAPELLLNLLCHGTVEQGLDVSAGGVEYYNMCIDGAGLATVADSFGALETCAELDKTLTWAECLAAVRSNFEGADGERIRASLRTAPKFGSGGSRADDWALRVSRLFTDVVNESPTPDGFNTIPGFFSWANTIQLGREVGATPDGRLSGAPISHGANPNPGFRRDNAPTCAARAVAMIQPGWGNTAPWQLELVPDMTNAPEAIGALIKTHFALGGTLININILDRDAILAADKDPSAYPDLIVRVTGFTAYFSALSPEFRRLVTERILN